MSSTSTTSSLPPFPPSHHHSAPISLPQKPITITQKFHNTTPTIRTRLSTLCREGKPDIALQVFDRLPRPTSTVLWNTIIIGFICNDMSNEALALYSRMKWLSLMKGDSYTYSSVLKACADTRQLRVGKAVHCHVLRSGIFASSAVYNSLLNMYCCCLADSCASSGLCEVDLVGRVFDMMKKRNAVAWNIMVSWYVKTGRFYEAVACFKQMMKIGIKPTVVGFVNVFPAVSGLLDVKAANALYGLLIKFGEEYASDLFAVSSAISMFSAVGYAKVARKVFDLCLGKNAEVWNTMISGYLKSLCYVKALELFVESLECSAALDDLTLVAALTGVSQLQELNIGKQLHAHIMKTSMVSSINVVNAVIAMYSRCNSVEESFKVFHKMQERDAVSWNSIITAFVQNGLNEEGLMLVNEMQKQGFLIDLVTATALLSAASNLGSGSIGKQTHAYLIRHDIQFDGMQSYLIDMYAKCGLVEKSQTVFERTTKDHRDLAIWNAMISGNVQNDKVEEAISVFLQMLVENIMPDAVTIASILPACCQVGGTTMGKQLHGFAICRSFDGNVFVASALVDLYSKSGNILSAENVFCGIADKNHVAYTNMILAYAQHGMGSAALSLFNSMQYSGVAPDPVTLVAALSACSYAGLVREGLEIFSSMETKYKIKPTAEHYCCMVDMLGRNGSLTEASLLAEKFDRKGGIAVRAWGSLLAACKVHGRYDLAKFVADKLLDKNAGDSISGYFVSLSNVYVNEGDPYFVDRLRKQMQERGFQKESGCSWIEEAGCVNVFVSKDKKHEKSLEIYELLTALTSTMKNVDYDLTVL